MGEELTRLNASELKNLTSEMIQTIPWPAQCTIEAVDFPDRMSPNNKYLPKWSYEAPKCAPSTILLQDQNLISLNIDWSTN